MSISNALLARVVTLCVGSVLLAGGVSAATAVNPRSWNGHAWARSGDLNIQLVNNVSDVWAPYLQAAADEWSAAAHINYTVVTGPPIDASVCSPSYGVVEVCSANYGKNGYLGITNIYTSGGYIVMATIKWNDYYPSTSSWYAGSAWYMNTACHELGHALGLTHQDSNKNNANSGSCLDSTGDPSGKRVANGPATDYLPGTMDFAALADIYSKPSGTQLVSTTSYISADGSFVPEPLTWIMMMSGFGIVGMTMRRRSRPVVASC